MCHYQSVPRTTCGHVLAPGARSERSATAAHLLHRRATPRPTAGLRTPSRRSDCSNSPYPFASEPGSRQAWGRLRAPGRPSGELLPIPLAVPKRPADSGPPPPPPPPRAALPRLPSAHPPGRPERLAGFVCAAVRGSRGMRPRPRGRSRPGQLPLPTARRRPPSGAPRLRGTVAARARAGEAAPYLSLRSRGASLRAASASPPPLLRSRRASSCSRRRDRRAEPAAAACAGAPLRLASPAHPACALRPGPAHRGRGARGHPAWSRRRHSHLRSPISQMGRLTHPSA